MLRRLLHLIATLTVFIAFWNELPEAVHAQALQLVGQAAHLLHVAADAAEDACRDSG